MDEKFKLSNDDTIRRLRTIAQAPGELQWRLELLSTLERMRVQAEVNSANIMQNQMRLGKAIAHLTPVKLAELINLQIEEKLKPRDRDVNRLWKAAIWILQHAAVVGFAFLGVWLGVKK